MNIQYMLTVFGCGLHCISTEYFSVIQGVTGLSEAVETIKKKKEELAVRDKWVLVPSIVQSTSRTPMCIVLPVHVQYYTSMWAYHSVYISCSDIASLTREVNILSNQLNRLSEENEALRNQLGLDMGQQVDLSPLRLQKRNKLEKLNEQLKLLANEVPMLDFNPLYCPVHAQHAYTLIYSQDDRIFSSHSLQ